MYTADTILQLVVLTDLAHGLAAGGIRGRINKGVDRLFDHIVRPVTASSSIFFRGIGWYWAVKAAS